MKKFLAIIISVIAIFSVMSLTSFAGSVSESGNMVNSITVPVKAVGNEKFKSYEVSYTNLDIIMDSYAGAVVPVTVANSGVLYIKYDAEVLEEYMYVELYTDKTLKTKVGYSESINSDKLSGTLSINVPKTGNYYLAFYSYTSNYSDPYKNVIDFSIFSTSNANRTVKMKTWSNACYKEGGTYFKFKIDKTYKVTVKSDDKNVNILLTNSKKSPKQKYDTYLNSDNSYCTTYILSKGTYYFLAKGPYDGDYKLKISTSSISTLKEGKYATVYQADSDLNMYVKIVPAKSGYIRINVSNYYGYITLCNSKRKTLSTKEYINSESGENIIFGVTKGKTYYLRLNNNEDRGKIKFTSVSVKDNSASSRKKATSLSTKKALTGYIPAENTSNKDWFKFKLSKSRYWKIDIKGRTNDALKISIYDSNGELIDYANYYDSEKSDTIYSYNKWSKGTYYVCITGGTKQSSGYYSLAFKTSSKSLKP